MEPLVTTSFDRYARYTYLWELRGGYPSEAPLRILDVGDPYGTIAALFPDDHTVSLDLFREQRTDDPTHSQVIGSGFSLPFGDGAFDVVASHDVLEHVPADGREAFLAELLRVSKGPVVVVAPFHDPRTARCEEIVNSYYIAHLGHSLEPLDEHADGGLPEEAAIARWLDASEVPHVVYSDGWLYHWLAFMLLKAHFVSMGAARLDQATDEAFNRLLRDRDAAGPHYRRAFVLRPPRSMKARPRPPAGSPDDDLGRLTALGWQLAAALPRGEDPSAPGSTLRRWIEDHRDDGAPVGELAVSLRLVLDEAEVIAHAPPPEREQAAERKVRIGVVLIDDGADATLAAALGRLGDEGIATHHVCVAAARTTTSRPEGVREVVHPDVVLRLNAAVDTLDSDLVLFLDAAAEVPPGFLAAMVEAFDHDGTGCVGFGTDGGDDVLAAMGLRRDDGESLYAPRDVLLVDRSLYQSLGGFDGSLRGWLDDVDFGWRVWSSGRRVRLAGEVPRVAAAQPSRALLEQSYLRMILKNLDEPGARSILPHEILLLLARVALAGDPAVGEAIARTLDDLDAVLDARERISAVRRRSDAELFERFGKPAAPTSDDRTYHRIVQRINASFDVPADGALGSPQVVVVQGADAARAAAVADALGPDGHVLLAGASPAPPGARGGPHAAGRVRLADEGDDLVRLTATADVVVVPVTAASAIGALAASDAVVVVDLGDTTPTADERADAIVLRRGDFFVCGTERQRDHWLARLHAQGRPTPLEAERDPSLRNLIDVVPGPFPARPPIVPESPRTGPSPLFALLDLAGAEDDTGLAEVLLTAFADLQGNGLPAHLGITVDAGGSVPAGILRAASGAIEAERMSIHEPHSDDERHELLSNADVVVRATGAAPHLVFRSAAPMAEILCSGTPAVIVDSDPGAFLARDGETALVTRPSRLLEDVHRLVTDPSLREALAAALAADGGPRWETAVVPLRRVVGSPWRWRGAHRGGMAPRPVPRSIQALLEAHRLDTHRLQSDLDLRRAVRALEGALEAKSLEAGALRRATDELTAELAAERAFADRIRRHPAARAFRLLKRLL